MCKELEQRQELAEKFKRWKRPVLQQDRATLGVSNETR